DPASRPDGHNPRRRPRRRSREADVVLVDGDSINQYGPPTVTLGGADCGQAGALPADATAVQIDAALLAAAAGLIVRVPSLPSPSFEALDDSEAPLLTPRETRRVGRNRRWTEQQGRGAPARHLPAHHQIPRRVAVSQAWRRQPRRRRAKDCGNDCLKSEPQTQ